MVDDTSASFFPNATKLSFVTILKALKIIPTEKAMDRQ
jgi:hypothetical protein